MSVGLDPFQRPVSVHWGGFDSVALAFHYQLSVDRNPILPQFIVKPPWPTAGLNMFKTQAISDDGTSVPIVDPVSPQMSAKLWAWTKPVWIEQEQEFITDNSMVCVWGYYVAQIVGSPAPNFGGDFASLEDAIAAFENSFAYVAGRPPEPGELWTWLKECHTYAPSTDSYTRYFVEARALWFFNITKAKGKLKPAAEFQIVMQTPAPMMVRTFEWDYVAASYRNQREFPASHENVPQWPDDNEMDHVSDHAGWEGQTEQHAITIKGDFEELQLDAQPIVDGG